jgi:hypothetical protein
VTLFHDLGVTRLLLQSSLHGRRQAGERHLFLDIHRVAVAVPAIFPFVSK